MLFCGIDSQQGCTHRKVGCFFWLSVPGGSLFQKTLPEEDLSSLDCRVLSCALLGLQSVPMKQTMRDGMCIRLHTWGGGGGRIQWDETNSYREELDQLRVQWKCYP